MKADSQIVIIFDGVCNLCNATVQWIIKRDKHGVFKFIAVQDAVEWGIIASDEVDVAFPDSVLVLQQGILYSKSDAALIVARYLSFPYSMMLVFKIVPKYLRNLVYDYIARNRYKWFGKKNECMIPTPELKSKFLSKANYQNGRLIW